MNQTNTTQTKVSNIEKFLRENYSTLGATQIAKQLNEQGFKTPRGQSVKASWVTQKAYALGLYKAGRTGANRTKRRAARMTANPSTVSTSNVSGVIANFAGIIATSKLPQAVKQKMFSALI